MTLRACTACPAVYRGGLTCPACGEPGEPIPGTVRGWVPDERQPQPGAAGHSDEEVAAAHGVTRETVWAYRRRHGIAPGGRRGRPRGTGWVPDRSPMPGEASDVAVAKAHGKHQSTVKRWRARHGVAPFRG